MNIGPNQRKRLADIAKSMNVAVKNHHSGDEIIRNIAKSIGLETGPTTDVSDAVIGILEHLLEAHEGKKVA